MLSGFKKNAADTATQRSYFVCTSGVAWSWGKVIMGLEAQESSFHDSE